MELSETSAPSSLSGKALEGLIKLTHISPTKYYKYNQSFGNIIRMNMMSLKTSILIAIPGFFLHSCCLLDNHSSPDEKYSIFNIQQEDFICDYNDFKNEILDASYDCLITSTPYDLGNDIEKNIRLFDGLSDIFIRYNISCNSQRFILFFSLTKKGNGYLYIPITANHFQAIKVFDAHDDGNIFSPPCASIQISDSSSDNLNVLKISICLEENEELSSFRKKYIINRIFIQNSSGLFFEYQHEDKPIFHLSNTYP